MDHFGDGTVVERKRMSILGKLLAIWKIYGLAEYYDVNVAYNRVAVRLKCQS